MKSIFAFVVVVGSVIAVTSASAAEVTCDVSVTRVIKNSGNDPDAAKHPQIWDSRQWFSHYKNGREVSKNRLSLEELKRTTVKDYQRLLDGKPVTSGIPMLNSDGDKAYASMQGDVDGLKMGDYVVIMTQPVNDSIFVYASVYQNNNLVISANGIINKTDKRAFVTADSQELAKLRETGLAEIEIFQKLKLGAYVGLDMSCNNF